MIIDYFFSILVIASIAVLWRNILHDLPSVNNAVTRLPWVFKKSLKCGFCFTYWLALIFTFVFNPLQGWLPPLRFNINFINISILKIIFSWLIVGMGAVIIRFIYAAIQELVHYQVHILNTDDEHKH